MEPTDLRISEFIAKEMAVTDDEAATLNECIPIYKYSKGTILLKEGQVSTESYFTISGCVRSYQIVDGDERTTAFYTEGMSIASLTSYVTKKPAAHYLACVEDCTLAVLSFEKEQELYEKHPKFEALCRHSIEGEFGKQQELLASFLTKSPEERYLHLQETSPELLNRVPQYHLATYLGVKPESLSRIRKRLASR